MIYRNTSILILAINLYWCTRKKRFSIFVSLFHQPLVLHTFRISINVLTENSVSHFRLQTPGHNKFA